MRMERPVLERDAERGDTRGQFPLQARSLAAAPPAMPIHSTRGAPRGGNTPAPSSTMSNGARSTSRADGLDDGRGAAGVDAAQEHERQMRVLRL